jgi:predicted house-cleaning noncanonical NTP pyrophosphatase (MazG superfamily)
MKQNGYSVSDQHIDILIDELGDEHVSTSVDTPLRADAFELSDDEKIEKIATHFGSILKISQTLNYLKTSINTIRCLSRRISCFIQTASIILFQLLVRHT